MDPLTHGIAGALLGKAFFSSDAREDGVAKTRGLARLRSGQVPGAALIATLAAIFPDVDVYFDTFVPRQMATLELHRGVTHSVILLPLWSLGLALLTAPIVRWMERRRHGHDAAARTPRSTGFTLAALSLIYAAGIASHILLDLITSFGTMIWAPVSNARATWDLVFILDFVFSAILLVPQLLAWVYARREGSVRRGIRTLAMLCTLLFVIYTLAMRVSVPFAPAAVTVITLLLASIVFGPQAAGWGFNVRRAAWCRAGVALAGIYLAACAAAHAAALRRVDAFVESARLDIQHRAALPMPPWLLNWSGQIRTPRGVFISNFNLRDAEPPKFHVMPDSPANPFVETARRLPEIQTYLWFARFPVVRYFHENDLHIVEFNDTRFLRDPNDPRPGAFQYRVVMDGTRKVLAQYWVN